MPRRYRERVGLRQGEVAAAMEWSYVQKVGLVESGKRKLAPAEVDRLVDLYALSPAEAHEVRELGRESRRRDPAAAVPVAEHVQTYSALEAGARRIDIFQEEVMFDAGAYTALGTSFTVLYLGEPASTFVYVEVLSEGVYHDRPPGSDIYVKAFDQVWKAALPEAKTLQLLDRQIQNLGE
nr:Scr1 family TA system antitoxin-like transcriptional regulator [Streptoalloteichus tenebrarius]BFF02373.1 hypothetical protein GCM10020241_40480 [Streptoalloteichus tenebrarius]